MNILTSQVSTHILRSVAPHPGFEARPTGPRNGPMIMSHPANLPRPKGLPQDCSNKHLYDAVCAWIRGAPHNEVAELLNVPVRTVTHWTKTREWHYLVNAARIDMQGEANSTFGRLANMSLEQLADRLENGDEALTKGGIVVRKKVSARDLASIAAIMIDRKEAVERKLDGIPDKRDTFDELFKLADALRAANAKEIQGEATTISVSDVSVVPSGSSGNEADDIARVEADRGQHGVRLQVAERLRVVDSGG